MAHSGGSTKTESFRAVSHSASSTELSISEAAALCHVSVDTIRRRVRQGLLEGAYRDGDGLSAQWMIPVSALVRSGLCDESTASNVDQVLSPDVNRLLLRVSEVEAALRETQIRLEAAEQRNVELINTVEHQRRIELLLAEAAAALNASERSSHAGS